MTPDRLECTECGYSYKFPTTSYVYYIGKEISPQSIKDHEMIGVPTKPVWCCNCSSPSWVEDIRPLQEFEEAYVKVSKGLEIRYPICNFMMEKEIALENVLHYINLRKDRSSKTSCLECGGSKFLPIPETLLKHEECENGILKEVFVVGGGTYLLDKLVFNGKGTHIGRLQHFDFEIDAWEFKPCANET